MIHYPCEQMCNGKHLSYPIPGAISPTCSQHLNQDAAYLKRLFKHRTDTKGAINKTEPHVVSPYGCQLKASLGLGLFICEMAVLGQNSKARLLPDL